MVGAAAGATPSPPPGKPRRLRKISMPWFRQSSFGMSLARLRLPKQHTIATGDESGVGGVHLGADGRRRSKAAAAAGLDPPIARPVKTARTTMMGNGLGEE